MNSSLPLEADSCADSDPRVTVALQEYIHLLEHGTAIEQQEWFQRHSEILPQMRDSLEGLRLLQAAAPALRSALAETECVVGTDAFLLDSHGAEPLGDFLLRKQIGRGGMGVVYEACQLSLGRNVAVKLLPFAAAFDPTLLRRFRQEAQAAAQLHHPHIVPVFTVGCERGLHYYAMQLIDGRSLATVIEELRATARSPQDSPDALAISVRQPLWFRTVAQFGLQAAQALSFAHEQGIVHRDIKPANLLVDARGDLFVTDFGLAATRETAGLTMSGNLLGTLRYASPEQVLGKRALVDHRTDIYSLGATLYELVTLVPPFPGDDQHSLLQNIAHTSPKPPRHFNPSLPIDLETILLKAISRDRDDRFESAANFAAELQRFLEGHPIQTRRPSLIDRTWKKIARRPRLAVGAFAALVISVAVLAASTLLITRARNDAVRLRDLAEKQAKRLADLGQVAEQRRVSAMEHEQSKLWQRYASDMRLAELMLQHFKLAEAQHLLRRYIPPETAVDVREFAWRYLWQRCRGGRQELRGHQGAVYYISWAPDGTSLATASKDGTVRLWEVPSGRLVRILEGHLGEVNCVSFSNDGKQLASASDDHKVRLWDSDGKSPPKVFAGHTSSVVGVTFSPVDDVLVSVDRDGKVVVWDIDTGEPLASFPAHSGRIQAVEFSPDGRRLATAGDDSVVRIWDARRLAELQTLRTLRGHEASIHCLAWSHDGQKLATGGWDKSLRVWDGGDGSLRKLAVCSGGIQSVAFSPDDRYLACATDASVVHEFEMPGVREVGHLLGHVDRCWCVRFSPKGNFLASSGADGVVNIWPADPTVRQIETQTADTVHDLRFDSTGRHLISIDVVGEMQLREPKSGKILFEFSDGYDKPSAIACTSDEFLIAAHAERELEFWNLRVFPPQRVQHPMSGHPYVSSVSRDGTRLICGNNESEIWNVVRHERFPITTTFYGQPVFSPDKQWVVDCGSPTGSWWSQRTNQRWPYLFVTRPEQLEFSPDGKNFFVGSAEGLVHRFRLGDSEPSQQYLGSDASIEDLAVSPDGKTLVAGGSDGAIRFWNINAEHEMFSIQLELGPVRAMSFSPDGQFLMYSTGPKPPDKGPGAIRILHSPLLEPQP